MNNKYIITLSVAGKTVKDIDYDISMAYKALTNYVKDMSEDEFNVENFMKTIGVVVCTSTEEVVNKLKDQPFISAVSVNSKMRSI